MSAIGLVNLAERLSNQSNTPNQEAQPAQRTAVLQGNSGPQGIAEDQFTPSGQGSQPTQAAAQAAGLFNAQQTTIFSPAASLLLGAQPLSQTNPGAAAAPAVAAKQPQVPGAANYAANAVNVANTQVAAVTTAPATTAAPPASTATLAEAQAQLQALNLALAGLGLNTQQIQQLDEIASIINDYNPAAYTTQAFQLEALAQKPLAPAAAQTGANAQLRPQNANTNAAKASTTGAKAKP